MKIALAKEVVKDNKVMCEAYADTLIELANQDERVVALDADLATVVNMKSFEAAHPNRFINCGIAEANMISTAAGLSATGMVPFAHSFTPFVSRRCYDQVYVSGSYAKLNVRVVGSDPGVTASFNGGTHQAYEDMGIMRGIPEMTVIEATDNVMLKEILKQLKDYYGMFYLRILRIEPDTVYAEGSTFEIGKGVTLRDGKDVTIIASGIMVSEALKAADQLAKEGVCARVVDMFTWKPIDTELIEKCAKETGCIVTAENHNIRNGLYSAVAEVLAETCPVPLEAVGNHDRFGEVGSQEYVQNVMGMTAAGIVEKVHKAITRK